MPESFRVELEENRRPKRLAFSVGELATEPSERIRRGKADLQKLLEMFLARGQKDLSVGEPRRSAYFCLMKVRFARRRVSLQRFSDFCVCKHKNQKICRSILHIQSSKFQPPPWGSNYRLYTE